MTLRQYWECEIEHVDRWARNFLIDFLPDIFIVNRVVRPALARLCGMKCGHGSILQKGVFYGNVRNVQIGNKSSVGRGAFLDGYSKITIGNMVGIAFQVTFITSTHTLGDADTRTGQLVGKPIVIGDGVWIGARAIIGPGTEVGAASMLATGTALMRSVPANSLVAGVPGKVVTRLPNASDPNRAARAAAAGSAPKG